MKCRPVSQSLPILAVFLLLVPTAMASNTWYVDGVNGKNKNDCKSPQTACKTIGHAISLAHSGDSIMIAAATYTEHLTIGFSLKIVGSDATTTIIDGGGVNTVVSIPNSGAHVALSRVAIRNGFATLGGGINNSGTLRVIDSTLSGNRASCSASCAVKGGGIYNSGTLTVIDSTFSLNQATVQCKRFQSCFAGGGGIENEGTLTVNHSSFTENSAGCPFLQNFITCKGGGIDNLGGLTINNSTLSKNDAEFGGGINDPAGTLTINNSTLSGNSAIVGGGIASANATISNSTLSGNRGLAHGGGISGAATLENSIVANSSHGGNCSGTMTSNGYNLSSDGTCNFNNTGDLNNTDPKLGQLGNHGGPTQTIPLLFRSPAIDAGNPNGCTDDRGHLLQTDQRGKPRPDKEDTGGCDMGAFERQKD
jgi:hypothetical protein